MLKAIRVFAAFRDYKALLVLKEAKVIKEMSGSLEYKVIRVTKVLLERLVPQAQLVSRASRVTKELVRKGIKVIRVCKVIKALVSRVYKGLRV